MNAVAEVIQEMVFCGWTATNSLETFHESDAVKLALA
jgi:hypothetical protein